MSRIHRIAPFLIAALLAACGGVDAHDHGFDDTGDHPALSWPEFRRMTFREPSTGLYIFDGDTVARDEKELRLIWESNFAGPANGLIVHRANGGDARWNETEKKNLTYCVSTSFGSRYDTVVADMKAASEAWEATADVDFHHVADLDGNCTNGTAGVVFDVNPAGYASYLARAFFPNYTRAERNVLIADAAFDRSDIPLVGVLRHELGHVLGFRHEHTRPEAGTCFEDSNWRALTPYDAASVMHYPQCNGRNTWQLPITEDDAAGAANLYGAKNGGTQPTPGNPGNPEEPSDRTPSFTGSLQAGKRATHGPVSVIRGREIAFGLDAAAGTKMYVRFGSRPTTRTYDALVNPGESITKTVPANRRVAYLLVVAASGTATDYDVFATMSEAPSPPSQPSQPVQPKTYRFSGNVAQYETANHANLEVRAGQSVTVSVEGSGDPDLFVWAHTANGATTTVCEANRSGADTCTFTMPEGLTHLTVGVYGYSAGSYDLTVRAE